MERSKSLKKLSRFSSRPRSKAILPLKSPPHRGLYVHVPFCVSKCSYCDFYSLPLASSDGLREAYVEAVLQEAQSYLGSGFRTLYIGGGTPSLLGSHLLERLLHGLQQRLDLSKVGEVSIETNPDSATGRFLGSALEMGITRLSIGVQSLSDVELRSVGRPHNSEQAIGAIQLARRLGFTSCSADLMIGLPGQTWDSLKYSIQGLLELGVDHLSVYCLSVEEGTPLSAAMPENLPSEDDQATFFEQAMAMLTLHGLCHYEISNFSRPGHNCIHNLNYWRGGEYLGLGPAAASHWNGKRFKNRADLKAYLYDPTGQVEGVEQLDIKAKAAEETMLRLRLLEEGVDVENLSAKYGKEAVAEIVLRLESMTSRGYLVKEGERYRLAPERVLTSNPIFAEVLAD